MITCPFCQTKIGPHETVLGMHTLTPCEHVKTLTLDKDGKPSEVSFVATPIQLPQPVTPIWFVPYDNYWQRWKYTPTWYTNGTTSSDSLNNFSYPGAFDTRPVIG